MKQVIALTLCLLSFNSFAESFSARCSLTSVDEENSSTMIAGSTVTVDKNHSFKLGTIGVYSFEARSTFSGVKATVVDLKTGATMSSLDDDRSGSSAILVEIENTKLIMNCTKSK